VIRPVTSLRGCLAGACAMLVLGMSAQAAPDIKREGVFSIGIPAADMAVDAGPAPLMQAEPGAEDINAVWVLGTEGKWEEAAGRLEALRGRYGFWQAPAGLVVFISSGQREQKLRAALAAEDWSGVLSFLPPPPAQGCERPDHLWARADSLQGVADLPDLEAFFVRSLTSCRDTAQVAALAVRAAGTLNAEGLSALVQLPSLSGSDVPEVRKAHAGLVQAKARLEFAAAKVAGDADAASAIAERSGDAALLAEAGWLLLETDAARAATHFSKALAPADDAATRRGLILAALKQQDFAGARSVISAATTSHPYTDLLAQADLGEARLLRDHGQARRAADMADRAARLDPALAAEAEAISGGALLEAAGAAYDSGDFAGAFAFARKAAAYPSVRRAADMRAAWAELQTGDASGAATSFSILYRAVPDEEAAEGFALAAQKAGQLDSAEAVARAAGGPLGQKVQARYASAAFYTGDYLTARALAPETYPALGGIERTLYRQTLTLREQDGAPGENKMTGLASVTSVEAVRGTSRYEAGLTLYRIDNGGAGEETFAAPHLAWTREGETSLAARIGLMPVGGAPGAEVTGEVAAVRSFGKHSAEVRAYVRPRTDSLLSFSGNADPAGADTGPVAETGALVRGRFDAGGGRAVQAEVSAASIGGRGRVENTMVSAGLSASQAIGAKGFDYLVTGPFYQFQAYDRNTNFYSAGNGGYFSPQQFHRAGWSLNARTQALKDWIVKADAALAYEDVREDAGVQFPVLSGPATALGGGSSAGLAGSLDLSLARKLSRDVIISANVAVTASRAFEDVRTGIGLVWVPGGRSALVPSDLATDPFSPGSWIRP